MYQHCKTPDEKERLSNAGPGDVGNMGVGENVGPKRLGSGANKACFMGRHRG